MAQGASPVECLIDGSSVGYVFERQPATYYVTARDAYANLARNGEEALELRLDEVASLPPTYYCPYPYPP